MAEAIGEEEFEKDVFLFVIIKNYIGHIPA
jgi:hypothetical protein